MFSEIWTIVLLHKEDSLASPPTRNEYQQKILFEYSGLVGEIVEEQVKRSTKRFSQFY